MGLKLTAYIINSDPGHTRSKQQLDKTLKIPSLSKKDEDFVKKINSNEFRFRDTSVLEIKNISALNLIKTDFTMQVNLQEVIDIQYTSANSNAA